jgi:beta-phosphoglucomutase-like phosphatase (HAD superfamily)/predicted enzyme related to lactoylglutathione lyase
MKLDHIGIEVHDLYNLELFYRKALGFTPRYRYVSKNTPGLRTVFLERDGVRLELLERSRDKDFLERRQGAPNHLSLEVDDVDASHAELMRLGLTDAILRPPRNTGDGFREMELRDPEGNVIELSSRIAPEPRYPVRAVIFDFDGTLVDSEPNYYRADREMLGRRGIPFTAEEKRRYIGGSSLDMWADLRLRLSLPESADELVALRDGLYLEIALAKTEVFPEMRRLWDRVRGWPLPIAVASGSAPNVLRRLLAAVGLAGDGDVVVSAEEVARGKPAPDVFLEAARRLGVSPEECVVVEDTRYGVEAAKRAFMRCVAVPYLVEPPLADAFLMADLLFADGIAGFDADRAFAWLEPLLTRNG